jgi:hypothetical protein
MSLATALVPFLVFRNSKSRRATPFSFFCSWIRLAAVVNTMGGGLLDYTGAEAAASSALDWAGASVSILASRGGGVEIARCRYGWRLYTDCFGSAGCLSRKLSLPAADFLASVVAQRFFPK